MKKMIKNSIIVIIISTCLYMLRNLILNYSPYPTLNTAMDSMNLTVCIIIAVIITAILFLYSYRTPALNEVEFKKKIYEYLYVSYTPEERQILDAMSEEDKGRFTDEILKIQNADDKAAMMRALGKYQFPSIPDSLKPVRKIMGVVIIVGLIFGGYTGWNKFSPEILADYAAQEAARNEIIEDQILYIEGLPPIEIKSNNTFNKMKIEKFINEVIKKQSVDLLKTTSMIILCSEDVYLGLGYPEWSGGTTLEQTIAMKNLDSETLTHELAHTFDNVYGISESNEMNLFFDKYKHKLDLYSSNGWDNTSEFFAEITQLYFNNTEYLKSNAEDIYVYCSNLYK